MSHRFGEAWDLLFAPPVAHRGLWSPHGAPENSLAGFQAACAAGYGIELDVQLSADGEAMVFHDDTLARLTGRRAGWPSARPASSPSCGWPEPTRRFRRSWRPWRSSAAAPWC